MKIISRVLDDWRYLFIAPFLFLAHATAIFLPNGIPLFSQEYLASAFILLMLCVPFSLSLVFGNLVVRIMTASILVMFFILSQVDQTHTFLNFIGYRHTCYLIILLLVISVSLYFIRHHMDKILFILFGVFLVGSFFTPTNVFLSEKKFDVPGKPSDASLPPYIHIILDEHIGIEGIPPQEDISHKFANSLKEKYVKNGFQVYGRAYSRYENTINSFASLFMLKAIDDSDKSYHYDGLSYNLKENELYEELSKNGYHINVIQSTHVNLCKNNENILTKFCVTYDFVHIADDALSLTLSFFMSALDVMRIKDFYLLFQKSSMGKALRLPLPVNGSLSSEAAYKAFPKVLELFKNAEKGNAYFVHLMLPHRPYRFNGECALMKERASPETETNYQYYLEQVTCVHSLIDQLLSKLEENSSAKNSTIVIHGDHGSRIGKTGSILQKKDPTNENFIQVFSTFFAIRSPVHKAVYDRRPLALDQLLNEAVLGKEHNNDRMVYLKNENGEHIRSPLPPFSHGLPTEKW